MKINGGKSYKCRIFRHSHSMSCPYARIYAKIKSENTAGGLHHGADKNRKIHRGTEKGKGHNPGAAWRQIGRQFPQCLPLGKWSFPNKRILRNNLCLPACKQKNIATKLRDTA